MKTHFSAIGDFTQSPVLYVEGNIQVLGPMPVARIVNESPWVRCNVFDRWLTARETQKFIDNEVNA